MDNTTNIAKNLDSDPRGFPSRCSLSFDLLAKMRLAWEFSMARYMPLAYSGLELQVQAMRIPVWNYRDQAPYIFRIENRA
jgi:hypothetical protein